MAKNFFATSTMNEFTSPSWQSLPFKFAIFFFFLEGGGIERSHLYIYIYRLSRKIGFLSFVLISRSWCEPRATRSPVRKLTITSTRMTTWTETFTNSSVAARSNLTAQILKRTRKQKWPSSNLKRNVGPDTAVMGAMVSDAGTWW